MELCNAPRFSIVITTYNRELYLEEAIQSVISQSFQDWEILVIDNYSTDRTDEILQTFKDTRIRVLKVHNNGSISISRNLGIKESIGEWIAFLDSDDWWSIDKLSVCNQYISSHVDFIYHDLGVMYSGKKRKDLSSRQLRAPVLIDLLLNGNPIAASSVVIRKSLFAQVDFMPEDPNLVMTADYKTWLKMASITNSFLHIPINLGVYRYHGNNVSSDSIFEPTLAAMSDYFFHLSKKQQNDVIGKLLYSQGKLRSYNENYASAKQDLIKVLRSANFTTRIKASCLLMQVMILINICKYFRGNSH
jgi:glycosyltransferase involved in cell wall biosynthesis